MITIGSSIDQWQRTEVREWQDEIFYRHTAKAARSPMPSPNKRIPISSLVRGATRNTRPHWLKAGSRFPMSAAKKPASREAGFVVEIPAKPTFALVSTIIGLASLTFVFGMGTRVSSQVIYRETAEGAAEPPVSA